MISVALVCGLKVVPLFNRGRAKALTSTIVTVASTTAKNQ